MIEQCEPVCLDVERLFREQQRHRADVADEVNHGDEEAHIALYAEASYETVEEDCLERKVGQIERETDNEQPSDRLEVERMVIERYVSQRHAAGKDQCHEAHYGLDVAAEEDEQGEDGEYDKRHDGVNLGKKP